MTKKSSGAADTAIEKVAVNSAAVPITDSGSLLHANLFNLLNQINFYSEWFNQHHNTFRIALSMHKKDENYESTKTKSGDSENDHPLVFESVALSK